MISSWRRDCGKVHWEKTQRGPAAPVWGILSNGVVVVVVGGVDSVVKLHILEKGLHTIYGD